MKYPEIPSGIAAFYSVDANLNTICILVEATSKENNVVPSSKDHFNPLAVGVAFFSEKDTMSDFNPDKGEVIALGRALKMYQKNKVVSMFSALPMTFVWK